jgi:hypothetical protein
MASNSVKIVQSSVSGGKNMISYEFFEISPRLFNDIFGLNLHKFEASIPKVKREFNKQITSKYKRPERFHKLDGRSRVMILLMYSTGITLLRDLRVYCWVLIELVLVGLSRSLSLSSLRL